MITATIDIYTLELETGFSFDLVTQSQLWNFDKLRGACVPSISFPNTERNRAILGHPNRFESRRTSKKEFENFELRSEGYLLIRGTLVLQDGFSGFVRGQVGNISAANADKLITGYTLPNGAFSNKSSYDPDTDDYCAPAITNRMFFKDVTKTLEDLPLPNGSVYEETILQHYHRKTAYLVNDRSGSTVYIPTDTINVQSYNVALRVNVVTPMLFLFKAISLLLKANNFFLRTNQFDDNDEIKSLIVYNNLSIINFKPNTQLNTGDRRSERPNVADWAFSHYEQSISPVFYKKLLPSISLKTFLLGIQNMLNMAIVFDDNNRFDIVDRETIITGSAVDIDDYFTQDWILGQKANNVLVFKMEHDNNDEYFGNMYQDLSEREDDFADDVSTVTELEGITSDDVGTLRRVLNDNTIYEFTVEPVTDTNGLTTERRSWKFISIDFQPVKYNQEAGVDKENETIDISFSTCAYQLSSDIRQIGRVNIRKNSEAAFSPRLLFNIANVGKNNTSNYLLKFSGTNNLLETRWPHTARFWANRQPVEGYFRFPAGVLASMINDVSTSGIRSVNHSKFSTSHGEFVIDKITTRFTHAGIGESKVEGWKIE